MHPRGFASFPAPPSLSRPYAVRCSLARRRLAMHGVRGQRSPRRGQLHARLRPADRKPSQRRVLPAGRARHFQRYASSHLLACSFISSSLSGYQYAAFWITDAVNASVRHPSLSRRTLSTSVNASDPSWETFTFTDYNQTEDDGHDMCVLLISFALYYFICSSHYARCRALDEMMPSP